jgi:hypothetical protein
LSSETQISAPFDFNRDGKCYSDAETYSNESEYESQYSPESELLTESVLDGDEFSTTISENETITSASLEFDIYGNLKSDTESSSSNGNYYESQSKVESLTESSQDSNVTLNSDNDTQIESPLQSSTNDKSVPIHETTESQTGTQSSKSDVSTSRSSTTTKNDLPTIKYFEPKNTSQVETKSVANFYFIGGGLAAVAAAAAGVMFFRRRSRGTVQSQMSQYNNMNPLYKGMEQFDNPLFDDSDSLPPSLA